MDKQATRNGHGIHGVVRCTGIDLHPCTPDFRDSRAPRYHKYLVTNFSDSLLQTSRSKMYYYVPSFLDTV